MSLLGCRRAEVVVAGFRGLGFRGFGGLGFSVRKVYKGSLQGRQSSGYLFSEGRVWFGRVLCFATMADLSQVPGYCCPVWLFAAA